MKIFLSAILFSSMAFAGVTRVSFESNLKNYTDIPTDELRASLFWQCSKKSWLVPNWPKSCGDGETFTEIDSEGNFSFHRVKTKQGNRHNSMQLRIYHNDIAIKLIDILDYKDELQEILPTISLYSLDATEVNLSLKSGINAEQWIDSTGRDSSLDLEIRFPNTIDGQNSRIGSDYQERNFNQLRQRYIIAVGDLGLNPQVEKRLVISNYALALHLESKEIFNSGWITMELNRDINEILENIVIDDTYLIKELSRIPSGKFRIALEYTNATRVYGDLIFTCEDGQIAGVFEYAWWDEDKDRHIYEKSELSGICGNDMAKIDLSTSRLTEQHTIKIDKVSYHLWESQNLNYEGVFDSQGNSVVKAKL